MKTVVIIPALNEAQVIGSVIDDVRGNVPGVDILVINDGSADATGSAAAAKGVLVVNLPFNLGIGAAMQTGYKYAAGKGYDIAIQFDGDGQHLASQIPLLLKPLTEEGFDIVIGSRFLKEGMYRSGLARLAGIKILAKVISFLSGTRITDSTSGFRAVSRDIIHFYSRHYPDDYPEPEAIVILHRAGFRITEVPVLMQVRQMGTSSITPLRAFYYMIKVLLAVMIDMIKKVPQR